MNSPYRKEQYLPHLKDMSFPKRWLFFDTETIMVDGSKEGSPMDFKLGYAIYVEFKKDMTIHKREEYVLSHQNELYEILKQYDKKKKKLMVVAHNIKFDLQVTDIPFKFFLDGIETEPPIQNGMTFIWSVKFKYGSLQFVDTVNYVPTSLENIGKDLGFNKLDIDLHNADYDTLLEYCRRDVMICEKFITEYLKFLYTRELGAYRTTLASQALTIYRTTFMKKQPYISNYQPALDLARNGYYGGRTECFFIGKQHNKEFFYLDFNSAYPYSMISDRLPTTIKMHRQEPSIFMLDYHLENSYVIADVNLSTNINAFPIRFNKDMSDANKVYHATNGKQISNMNGKLLFPIGEFRTVLHHSELEFARKYDMIISVNEYTCYDYAPLFKNYVEYFYDLKQEATILKDKTLRLMSKLFLNTLYGKFGQRYHNMQFIESLPNTNNEVRTIVDVDYNKTYNEIIWFGDLYKDTTNGESTYSAPSIAGAITANTRMLLWEHMLIAGLENVYYVDTDSIITNYEGFLCLMERIDKLKMGYLDIEDTSKFIDIRNNKDYSFGEYDKVKGVPKNARQINQDEWEYEWFEGWRTWRKRGSRGIPKLFLRTKSRQNSYNKGIVTPTGYVKPFIIEGELITNL